jgi:glycosyltransferase involved in cell wall biosynthesis
VEQEVMADKKRIAIFFWRDYLGAAPSILNAIHILSEEGFEIDVLTRDTGKNLAALEFNNHVQIIPFMVLDAGLLSNRVLDGLLNSNRKYVRDFATKIQALLKLRIKIIQLIHYVARSLSRLKAYGNVCLIGVDTTGLIVAGVIGAIIKQPVIYWSLEVQFSNNFSYFGKLVKRWERVFHRKANITIIQDWDRAKALSDENQVALDNFVIVPNGPVGRFYETRGNYFQRKFHLDSTQRVIVHAGMISSTVCARELAMVASNWQEDLRLVFHSSIKKEVSDPYIQAIQHIGGTRVCLSLDPVPYNQLDAVISSGQIGLAIYARNLGPNYELMAGASGKMAHYLRCGLPVICSNLPSLAKVVNDYQCGIAVENLSDIESAIATIFLNYDAYRSNAFRCYEEVYEFGKHFQAVSRYLHKRFT